MPFLQLRNLTNKNQSMANSLRAYLHVLSIRATVKRVSVSASRKLKGSMTAEAALALPLFLFFILQIMSVMNMIGMQSRLNAALHQTGNKMAFAGYVYEKTAGNIPLWRLRHSMPESRSLHMREETIWTSPV